MTWTTARRLASPFALALTALAAAYPEGAAGAGVSPLPRSDYTVRAACPSPAPRRASCLALQLVPATAAARSRTHPLGIARVAAPLAPSPAAGSFGLRPKDLHTAYGLPGAAPSAQTIAVVDAYNDPTADTDLRTYNEAFALPECSVGNGCLRVVNQNGEAGSPPFPASIAQLEAARSGSPAEREEAEAAEGWGLEISLDLEAAHATCQSCHLLLVEADSPAEEDLAAAEQSALALGAQEISNSWGAPEVESVPLAGAFAHPGAVITASAGDSGYLDWASEFPGNAEFPASSADVVAVGGTRLELGAGAAYAGESVWNGNGAGGGGCSVEYEAQPWQRALGDWSAVGCGTGRAVADVSADADPYTGIAVHDSSPECESEYEVAKVKHVVHWCTMGGTSLASPIIAAVFALAGGARGVELPARTLYENVAANPSSLHDVHDGSNGECGQPFDEETGLSGCTAAEEAAAACASRLICLAAPGYDGPTGVGTPAGISAFLPASTSARGAEGVAALPPAAGAPAAPASATSAPGVTPSLAPPAAPGASLSDLRLTARALKALRRGHLKRSQLGFSFSASAGVRVRVALMRQLRVGTGLRWRTSRGTLNIAALPGRNARSLRGSRALGPGRYRLTLAPADGAPISLTFRV